jgi:hypothetical protein
MSTFLSYISRSAMFDHFLTLFPAKHPVDAQGFDLVTNQGAAIARSVADPNPGPPSWLQHSTLKSPWLYVEKSTPNAHVAYTDVGDSRFVSIGPSCRVPVGHPSIVLNTPAGEVKVKLEDYSNTVHPKILWDQQFRLKNTAPGGNGIRIIGTQKSSPASDMAEPADFVPFCFKSLGDVDFFDTKYRMTVESIADPNDVSITPWKDVFIIRPRPLCDRVELFYLLLGWKFFSLYH